MNTKTSLIYSKTSFQIDEINAFNFSKSSYCGCLVGYVKKGLLMVEKKLFINGCVVVNCS